MRTSCYARTFENILTTSALARLSNEIYVHRRAFFRSPLFAGKPAVDDESKRESLPRGYAPGKERGKLKKKKKKKKAFLNEPDPSCLTLHFEQVGE